MSKSRSGAPRRVAAGLLAGALAIFGLALAPSAGADTVDEVEDACGRLAGQTRFGTAGAIGDAYATEAGGVDTAIIANGRNFPDALAASGLARTLGAPILLVEPPNGADEVPLETRSALDELGVSDIVIVGGTAAVSNSVEAFLEDRYGAARRVAGPLREDTAAEIAGEVGTAGEFDGLVTAIIATGDNYPDALAGGPLSYHGDGTDPFPILLTRGSDVPPATEDALNDLGIEQVIVLGGTAAVPATTVAELAAITGNDPIVLAGPLREDTAKDVADFAVDELGFNLTTALLADGREHFPSPDALSGGPLGGITQSPILLVTPETLPPATEDFLTERAPLEQVIALGGTAAISADVLEDACTAAGVPDDEEEPAGVGVTTRPELVSAAIVQTVTTGAATSTNPAGTTVRYVFDEPVTGAAVVQGNFHLYRWNDPNNPITASGGRTVVDPSNPNAVLAYFPTLTTTDNSSTGTANVTLATVDLGAVTDNQGQRNPEGDASISPGAGGTLAPGTTSAPDLVSISGFRETTTPGESAIDFTFDQAAFSQNTTGFHIIGINGEDEACTGPGIGTTNTSNPGGQNAPGGNGTTTITVTCGSFDDTTLAGQRPTAANVARGIVDSGTVGTSVGPASATTNPLQASNTPDQATTDPDLVSVEFQEDHATLRDAAIFTFDETVLATTGAGSLFRIYLNNGTEVAGLTTVGNTPQRNSQNTTQVVVFFPEDTITNAVGANVLDGAVQSAAGANPSNEEDEVAAAGTGTTVTAGMTNAPDLQSVALVPTNNNFGQLASVTAVYTFDEAITATITTQNLLLYLADGTRMHCAAHTQGTGTNNLTTSQVACTSYTFTTAGTGGVATNEAGTNTGTATASQTLAAVLGTVNNNAVQDASGAQNPEGAVATSGGNGTPTN